MFRQLLRCFFILMIGINATQAKDKKLSNPIEISIASISPAKWVSLGEGVYVIHGLNEDVNRQNAARVVNTGVIDTPEGVLLIDPGPSYQWGKVVKKFIRTKLHKPVRWIINTHPHPENVLANSAFADLPIYASQATTDFMTARCVRCLANLRATVGTKAMQGTQIVLPNHLISDGEKINFGGRELLVRVFPEAHSPSDTVLFDTTSHTLFAGGLAYRERIPEISEAEIDGWLKALTEIKALHPNYVVSAGLGTPAETIDATMSYLNALRSRVWEHLQKGEDATSALTTLSMQEWKSWRGFSQRQSQNLQHVWFDLEKKWLEGKTP